jgi:hypothetical protein
MVRIKLFLAYLCFAFVARSAAAGQAPRPPGPVMMVHFDYYPKDRTRIRILENRLADAIERAGAGELGETEFHIDGNDGYLYMYGPDPDRLYVVAKPILKSSKLMNDAEVTKWYGPRTEMFMLYPGRKRVEY